MDLEEIGYERVD